MNSKPTVLIIDDEKELLELLVEELSALDVDIVTAEDGKQALQMITDISSKSPIDAVLSDINMPNMTGLELLAEIRKMGNETPFVFLTGYGDKEKAILALKLGAMDFLEKPYNREVLLKSVEKCAQYGFLLRTVESELFELCKTANVPPEQLKTFKHAQRAILLMKKETEATYKKAK